MLSSNIGRGATKSEPARRPGRDASPSRWREGSTRAMVYSDRHIPSRAASLSARPDCDSLFASAPGGFVNENYRPVVVAAAAAFAADGPAGDVLPEPSSYHDLLHRELLRSNPWHQFGHDSSQRTRIFRYGCDLSAPFDPTAPSPPGGTTNGSGDSVARGIAQRSVRKFNKSPFKVLDAPSLQDDFYLNLVDWSAENVLVVGLGPSVYLWSAHTSKVTKLCDLSGDNNSVTSVSWAPRGNHLAVGTRSGDVEIWDGAKCQKLRTLKSHSLRVGCLAWNGHSLASGSRDRNIILRDERASAEHTIKWAGHRQEVCGLRWSFDGQQLASGGNDNKLLIWSASMPNPIARFSEHSAAVKALAWSPHQSGLLASGGGTADRLIRFWNTQTSSAISSVDTGSQVCNLMWSKTVNEIVSTHGYSLNQIIVWKYPTMSKLVTLTGHTYRVLYLAMSPDGETIVTGAGDETLRFWNVFPSSAAKANSLRLGVMANFPSGLSIR